MFGFPEGGGGLGKCGDFANVKCNLFTRKLWRQFRRIQQQGPQSNFEIGMGGGAPLVPQYWEGTRHFFLLTL